MVYSTAFLRESANARNQELATRHLGYREIVYAPRSIAYHEPSGNVIATLGLEGVLVGDVSGSWHRVAVESYSPTGFSNIGRLKLVFSEPWLWATALALSVSFATAALILSRPGTPWAWAGGIVLSIVVVLPSTLALLAVFPDGGEFSSIFSRVPLVVGMFLGVTVMALFLPHRSHLRMLIGVLLGMIALFALSFLIGTLQQFQLAAATLYAFLLLALASISLSVYLRRNRAKER